MKKVIKIKDKTYFLKFDDFDENIDVDSLLKIDYGNLLGELVTFPVVVNRFGVLLADAENSLAEAKLNLDVFEAKTKERLRKEYIEENEKAPTVDALNSMLTLDKGYQQMKKQYFEKQKMRDYINSIFWSAKAKDDKLSKLSLTLQESDVADSVLEGRVNNVTIKRGEKLIK